MWGVQHGLGTAVRAIGLASLIALVVQPVITEAAKPAPKQVEVVNTPSVNVSNTPLPVELVSVSSPSSERIVVGQNFTGTSTAIDVSRYGKLFVHVTDVSTSQIQTVFNFRIDPSDPFTPLRTMFNASTNGLVFIQGRGTMEIPIAGNDLQVEVSGGTATVLLFGIPK